MDDPIMPEPIVQPEPEPKPAAHRFIDQQPDGTVVDIEVHHAAVEL